MWGNWSMRKQFEELHPLFDLEKDEQGEYTCVLTRVTWLGFELGKKTLQAEIDQLKAQLNNMEQCYIQLKQINNEQTEIIRGHFSARQEMKKCIDAALYDIAQAKDGFYGYSSDGGDVDNLTKNIEKSLRGERWKQATA